MYPPRPLRVSAFGDGDYLSSEAARATQVDYLRCYLGDLDTRWCLEEPYYFDRDYLDEFASFYATSARGYANVCRRLSFFGDVGARDARDFRRLLRRAAGGDAFAHHQLRNAFFGFVVVRPIAGAPLGRTVLRWYPERDDALPRISSPRRYRVHVAGLALDVGGLAWQQQDSAVGACATVGVWTMLHSSAFDETHGIPTTASITKAAHRTASLGARVFPSYALTNQQLLEGIKEHGLAPIVLEGDKRDEGNRPIGFDRARFASSCAAFLRSGYPVLISGKRGTEGHVVCAVGFRPRAAEPVARGDVELDDATLDHLFVHDDAVGPSVRFRIEEGELGEAVLVVDAPNARGGRVRPVDDPTENVERFRPTEIIVAVHEDIRISPDHVHAVAFEPAQEIATYIEEVPEHVLPVRPGLGLSIQFVRLDMYTGPILQRLVPPGRVLASARFSLAERVRPMSHYLAVARIGVAGQAMIDILYDTSDSKPNLVPFAHVVFDRDIAYVLDALYAGDAPLGITVRGY